MKKILFLILCVMLIGGCQKQGTIDRDVENKQGEDIVDKDKDGATSPDDETGDKARGDNGEEEMYTFTAIVGKTLEKGLNVFVLDYGYMKKFEPLSVSYDKELDAALGDIVEITFNGMVLESYPGQIGAEKITVKEKKGEGWPATEMLDEDYFKEENIKDGNLVIVHGKEGGADLLWNFLSHTQTGIINFLRMISFTDEGDPIVTDVLYDGTSYHVFTDSSRDAFRGDYPNIQAAEYIYLNSYTKDGETVWYLANRENISNEEYEKSFDPEQEKDWIDKFVFYPSSKEGQVVN